MGLFSKKEKSVIPEAPKPDYGRSSAGASAAAVPQRKGKEDPLEQLIPERRYGREAPKYNPQAQAQSNAGPGGYGSYGNYGSYGQQSQSQPNDGGRGELFKGARAPSSRMGAGFDQYAGSGGSRSNSYNRPDYADGPAGGDDDLNGSNDRDAYGEQEQQGDEEDDAVEAVKQQIKFTKQESLATTRNAIRAARETEETATNTLTRLGEQTDRIANTELALDKAKGYNSRAADGAKDIRRLNQSIFRPTFQFNKQAKRDAHDAKVLARHLEEKNDREEARQAAYASRQRVEAGFRDAERSSQRKPDGPTGRAKWEQGGRYQFEATNSDDELEQELDDNLDEIAAISGRLKVLATTAGKEIDAQNKHLDKIGTKVDTLDDKIVMNTQYMKRIK